MLVDVCDCITRRVISVLVVVLTRQGLGIAVKLTFSGDNQLGKGSTWFFIAFCATCIVIQMNYLNKVSNSLASRCYPLGCCVCESLVSFNNLCVVIFPRPWILSTPQLYVSSSDGPTPLLHTRCDLEYDRCVILFCAGHANLLCVVHNMYHHCISHFV